MKSNGPAHRYEVAISIHSGNAVWANGPWPAGLSNLRIFRMALKGVVECQDEFAVADEGYNDIRCIQPPGNTHAPNLHLSYFRGLHEKFNERLKNSTHCRIDFVMIAASKLRAFSLT